MNTMLKPFPTNEQILEMCYAKYTDMEKSPENDEFLLDNPVLWTFPWEHYLSHIS